MKRFVYAAVFLLSTALTGLADLKKIQVKNGTAKKLHIKGDGKSHDVVWVSDAGGYTIHFDSSPCKSGQMDFPADESGTAGVCTVESKCGGTTGQTCRTMTFGYSVVSTQSANQSADQSVDPDLCVDVPSGPPPVPGRGGSSGRKK
jgi:hypothetical protein